MRKTETYTVESEGRDKGKIFLLTEWPAAKAEAWSMRAILALFKGKVDLPDGYEEMGLSGMARFGIQVLSQLQYEDAAPLLAEMLEGIEYVPDPSRAMIKRALMIDPDIEEVSTLVELRIAVWKLNVGFLKAAAIQLSNAVAARKQTGSQGIET